MPLEIVWEPKGVVWKLTGDIAYWEIEAENDRLYSDERSDFIKYQLIDASEITSLDVSEQQSRQIASIDCGASHSIKSLKVAFVTSHPEVRNHFQDYIKTCTGLDIGWQFAIFDGVEQAREWLTH